MVNYILWIAIVFLLVVLAVWIGLSKRKKIVKKRKEFEDNPPQEIIDKLNELGEYYERRLKEDDTVTPHQAHWEFIRNNKFGSSSEPVAGTEQATTNGELLQQPSGRKDIQTGNPESINKDSGSIGGNSKNCRRIFFSRFRRRK